MRSKSLALAVVVLLAATVLAQTYLGRILGTATDPSGAVVRGAHITVTNVGTGATRKIDTNEAGDYVAPNLEPGQYKVSIEAQGFKKIERSGIQLEVARDARIDFAMQAGAATDQITVTAEVPLIETTTNVLGGTFSNKSINDLPLNGRDFQNLVVLRPGVQRSTGGGFLSISSNGNRPEDNNFIVDGTDNNDPYYGTTVINAEGVQGTPGTILPIDAIQEFNAQENPNAEYGWKPGAIVNLGLKSGTNQFHGTAYYFLRNNILDARDHFNPVVDPNTGLAEAQKKLILHQYGFSAGGPIIKNKLFIFGAYEGIRSTVGNSGGVNVPANVPLGANNTNPNSVPCTTLVGDCANSIPDVITELTNLAVPISPLSTTLAGLFPANSGAGSALGDATQLGLGFPNHNRNDNVVVKSDWTVNDKNTITGRYFYGSSTQTEEDISVLKPAWLSQSALSAQVVGVNWTYVPNSRWVNEARFGYNRFWQTITTVDSNVNPTSYGINTGVTDPVNFGMPDIAVSGFTSLGGNVGWPLYTTPNQTWQFVDNVSWAMGKHTFRFGGEYRYGRTNNLRDRYGKSRIRFQGGNTLGGTSTPLEDFLAGSPTDGRIFIGNSQREVSIKSFGAFVQDEWKVGNRLTLNLGVRYDLNTVIKETHNLLGAFDQNLGLLQVGKQIGSPYDGDHNNFAPRIGVIWDPMGKGKTVVRAGFGMTYEIPHLAVFLGQNGVNNASTAGINVLPTGAVGVTPGGGSIVAASANISGGSLNYTTAGPVFNTTTVDCSQATGFPCDVLVVDRHLRTPYVFNRNLNVQQELWKNASIQIGYVGTGGRKLYSIYDINQVDPNSPLENAAGSTFDANGNVVSCNRCEQAGRPSNAKFPFLEFVNQLGNGYTSNYHGLQSTFTQRSWRGMTWIVGYTYSHSIDDASLNRASQPQDSLNPRFERGNSDLDIRHRLTITNTWELPSKKGFAQMLEGWQINNIVTLQGGQPWTGFDFQNDVSKTGEFSDRWNLFGNPADFQWQLEPNAPGSNINFIPDGTTDPRCAAHPSTALSSLGCYIAGSSVLTPPDFGAFGNEGRNKFRAQGLYNWDFSLVKSFKLGEKVGLQFRAEFFNFLNITHFENPQFQFVHNDLGSPGFGQVVNTPDVSAANPVIGTGGPRNIQLGIKFKW